MLIREYGIMENRYVVVLLIFLSFFFISAYILHSESSTTQIYDNIYWFSIFYNDRFWKVNTLGKIYDLYEDEETEVVPILTGLSVNESLGIVEGTVLRYIPYKIKEGIFEINLAEKYITTYNSAIVYVTDVTDIPVCINALSLTWRYLDPKVSYLFKNGKIYKIKG